MSILINKNSRIITQGITGNTGQFHTRAGVAYANGKQCYVAGVNPKKAGEKFDDIPIFGTVAEARKQTGANVSVIYVPPPFAAGAIDEAVEAGIELVICITEGIPVRDMINTKYKMIGKKTLLVGPNCPGVITPDEVKIGIMPGHDPETDAVIMVGEIGGSDEETAAYWVKANMKKPVVGFIAGVTAPEGKRMGHAGAIISGGKGTAQEKLGIMEECGIKVTRNPAEMGKLLKSALK